MRPNDKIRPINEHAIESLLLWASSVKEDSLHSLPAKNLAELCILAKEALLKRRSVAAEIG
jgi:hypothetical protein